MSDKHTDAQGSTYECGTGDVQRLPDRVVDALIDGAGVSRCAPGQGIYVIDQTAAVEKLVHDTCEELLARLPSPRATEGQAQTSAAPDQIKLLSGGTLRRETKFGGEGYNWLLYADNGELIRALNHHEHEFVESGLAAQLADSTAPGAPELTYTVDGEVMSPIEYIAYLHGELKATLTDLTSVQRKLIDANAELAVNYLGGATKPCGWLSGNDSDGASTMYWKREDAQLDCDEHNAYERSRADFDPENLRNPEPVYAAPTAQQSLTAGGAVPDDVIEAAAEAIYNKLPMCQGHDARTVPWQRGGNSQKQDEARGYARAALAAAPLPQVQSRMDPAFETDGNPCGYTWPTHKVIRGSATDHPPVTPSGALADNDGGVK
jgi:hypothetical protein